MVGHAADWQISGELRTALIQANALFWASSNKPRGKRTGLGTGIMASAFNTADILIGSSLHTSNTRLDEYSAIWEQHSSRHGEIETRQDLRCVCCG